MNKQSNFRCVFFIFTLSVVSLNFSFSQINENDSVKKTNLISFWEKNLIDYNNKQANAINRLLKKGVKKTIENQNEFSELIGENFLKQPQYFVTHNANVVNGLKANFLHNNFDNLNLEGEGIKIGLWENGQPRRAHEMFRTNVPPANLQSRIEYVTGQNLTIFRHATHVAGTLIGNQFQQSISSPTNTNVRGIAFKSTIKAWDWLNVPAEMLQAATTDNIKIANTSFGLNPIYMHPAEFGRYNEIAQQWDGIMCSNPEFQIVKSVGNARDDLNNNGFPQYTQVTVLGGYDLLEGAGIAKNVLVVGSVNIATENNTNQKLIGNNIQEPYSSWGATDDGRIKPDLVTHGNSVLSSIETQNNTYGLLSGTSQAAAGVTGGIALLHNYWSSKFPSNMLSSTVRALLIHNVDEIDEKGPDYRNGWGLVNLQKTANTIKQRGRNSIIKEGVLLNGETLKINLPVSGSEDLKITLAWTDPAGIVVPIDINNPNNYINETTSKLINDLDIRLIRKDANGNDDVSIIDNNLNPISNNMLFPWVLKQQILGNSELMMSQKAQRGDNNRDNVEKIEVYQNNLPPTGGMFQLQISHKGTLSNICQNGQPFSLVVSGISFCNNNLVFLQNQDNELADFTGTKVLANTIKASNIIKVIPNFLVTNNDFVEYRAADFIELLPQSINNGVGSEGFTAEYGSDFLAHIGCDGTTLNQRITFNNNEIKYFLKDQQNINSDKKIVDEIVAYPNPLINNLLNIQFTLQAESKIDLIVYDMLGKTVFESGNDTIFGAGTNKKTIDLESLAAGTYILLVKTSEKNYNLKFIKQ